ncbi:hypothetical protein LTR12_004865 [Friedmanniomyces endolithicus]|nr:hypothetical protein LTR74_002083 [Friedmanniomyces endolithicus]KAK1820701.1 hypothetical protein LTR12_004865 [Friedmanniomyces endolithicus]
MAALPGSGGEVLGWAFGDDLCYLSEVCEDALLTRDVDELVEVRHTYHRYRSRFWPSPPLIFGAGLCASTAASNTRLEGVLQQECCGLSALLSPALAATISLPSRLPPCSPDSIDGARAARGARENNAGRAMRLNFAPSLELEIYKKPRLPPFTIEDEIQKDTTETLGLTKRRQARKRLLDGSRDKFTASGRSALETLINGLEAVERYED